MLEILLAGYFNISATNPALIVQRKPEDDAIPKLTPEQQQRIDLTIAQCQKHPEIIDLNCNMTYEEMIELIKSEDAIIYDRPNLCDKFERLEIPWTQQEHIEYSNLECSIGD